MTPNNKTKLKGGAQIRTLSLFAPAQTAKRIDCENYVEGYAARYEPYVLYYDGDTPICERFERGALITVTWAISSTNMTTPAGYSPAPATAACS